MKAVSIQSAFFLYGLHCTYVHVHVCAGEHMHVTHVKQVHSTSYSMGVVQTCNRHAHACTMYGQQYITTTVVVYINYAG